LDAAFAPLAVIALGVAIFDLTENLKKEREELEKTKAETLNEALAVNQYANALQTNNLKLQDQLAILQKKPPTNGVKIAMEEGRKATADLVDEFTKAIDKLDELLQKQKQGFWDRLMNGDNGSNEVIEKAHEFKTEIDDLTQQMHTASALGHQKEAADYKASLDKKQDEFRRYIAEQQKALADKKTGAIGTLTKREESVGSGVNGETQVREALSLADATKQVNEQYRDEQRMLNDLTIYAQSQSTASAQLAKNNSLTRQIAVAEAEKSNAAFKKEQSDKVATVDASTRAIVAIDERASKQTMTADFAAIKAENDAAIRAANEQLQTWDEAYKGQIEVAKIASETKIQLITQGFEKGKITQQQEIALIAKAKQDELQLEIFYQQQRQALWDKDPKKVQEIQNQINKIKGQGELVGAKATTDELKASEQKWKGFVSNVSQSLNSAFSGWIQGTETFGQAWGKMADDMAMKFISSLEQQLVQFLVHLAVKDAADKAASAKNNLRSAYESAHNTYKWATGVVGPVIAGVLAAGAFVAAESLGSAEGGQYYVPNNQLTMLHPQEMVLPAGIANQMRSVIGGGGGSGKHTTSRQ
jgi:hypothetical protein